MLRSRPRLRCLGVATVCALALLTIAAIAMDAAATLASSSQTVVGRVVIAHQDGAKVSDSRMIPLVDTAGGTFPLRLAHGLPVAPGARVAVHNPEYADGAIVGGNLAMLGPPTTPSGVPTLGPANFTPGPRKVLVVLAQINGQPASASAADIRSSIFTAPNSANAFIQEESFEQLSLTGKLRADGDVFGPYSVVSQQNPDVCDYVGWGNLALSKFESATGMDPESWDNVIVIFQAAQCNFSGVGEVGQLNQGARHAWINPILTNGVPTTSVVAHELGHNFGVDHAGGLVCYSGSVRISFSEACAADPNQINNQYLDPFDVMGSGARQENAYHKWESGWLPSDSVLSVIRSGTYLLSPEESASQGIQLLEVPRADGAPSYWLDLRQPFGTYFDTFSPSDPISHGVSIRYANSSNMPHPSKSWLIDTTPWTASFADAPLAVGSTYTEASRGVSITTLALTPQGALVQITVANGADTSPPGPASGLTATLVGGSLKIGWTSASDDSGTVQHYRLRRNGVALADVYGDSALDPAPLGGRTSTYDVTSIDPAGNAGPTVTIQVSVADTSAPSAPIGLVASVHGSSASLSWSPSLDNVGVTTYEVDRDGQPIATGLQATSFVDPDLSSGTHVYVVRGFDAAGNASAYSAPISVVLGGSAAVPPTVKPARLKTVKTVKVRRVGKHRVLLSWKAQRGARRYQVLRAGKKPLLLATVKKVQYTDGKAPTGKLTAARYVVRAVLSS
jgi:hypothetical protein